MARTKTRQSFKKDESLTDWLAMPLHKPLLIRDDNGNDVSYDQMKQAYIEVLDHVRDTSNELIRDYHEATLQKMMKKGTKNRFGIQMTRDIIPDIPVPEHYKVKFRVKELTRKLVWSVLGSWAAREKVYRLLAKHPEIIKLDKYNEKSVDAYGHRINSQLFENVKRSINNGSKNTLPTLKQGKLILSSVNEAYARVRIEGNLIVLRTIVRGEWLTMYFEIPPYRQGHIEKIAKPDIEIVRNKLSFSFSIKTKKTRVKRDNGKYLSVDIGVSEAFTAIVMNNENKISDPLLCSPGLEKRFNQLKTYDNLIKRLNHKIKRHEQQGKPKNIAKHDEKERLISVRQRQKKDLPYLIARDVITHALNHNCSTIVIEDLKWSKNWRFGKTLFAIEHVAKRHGIKIIRVNPKNSSQTCPECTAKNVTHPKHKITTCNKCGWTGDRDYAAAIILAKTAKNKKTKKLTLKTKPRSRRPSIKTRKYLAKRTYYDQYAIMVNTDAPHTSKEPGVNYEQKPLSYSIRE